MKDDRVYLFHIQDALRQIRDYARDEESVFLSDRKTQDATIRNFEIIGEAVKNLSEDMKGAYPEIPWRDIAAMRDKLIHEYFGVKLQLVWRTIQNNLPPFEQQVVDILKALERKKGP